MRSSTARRRSAGLPIGANKRRKIPVADCRRSGYAIRAYDHAVSLRYPMSREKAGMGHGLQEALRCLLYRPAGFQ